jgi:uracil-DNA glycosylase
VEELASARIGRTFNQYARGTRAAVLRARLVRYLASRADAALLLVGEAPGCRGARVSGLPFTSERQVAGTGPAEATASVVRRTLALLGLEEDVLLWNVVPTHPGTSSTNRMPTVAEIRGGLAFLESLCDGRRTIAVGRVAERVLGPPAVRHPAHGGAREFESGLVALLERGELEPRA